MEEEILLLIQFFTRLNRENLLFVEFQEKFVYVIEIVNLIVLEFEE